MAVMNRNTLMTRLFMRAGALLYAYSSPVMDAKISERAMRIWVGWWWWVLVSSVSKTQ